MAFRTIERWREIVANKDVADIDSLLAENAVFHSPIVDTPQVGKEVTQRYLDRRLQGDATAPQGGQVMHQKIAALLLAAP